MKEINTSLSFIGLAAMSYVSHIANHPAFCKFFLIVGAVSIAFAVILGISTSIIETLEKKKGK